MERKKAMFSFRLSDRYRANRRLIGRSEKVVGKGSVRGWRRAT